MRLKNLDMTKIFFEEKLVHGLSICFYICKDDVSFIFSKRFMLGLSRVILQ
jgi:hypothetical protein